MQAGLGQSSGSGRARRDAAARAMQGWHSQRLLGNGEVGDPIIKVNVRVDFYAVIFSLHYSYLSSIVFWLFIVFLPFYWTCHLQDKNSFSTPKREKQLKSVGKSVSGKY